MKEEITAGGKQFLFVMLWAAVLYIVCGVMATGLSQYAVVSAIAAVLIFCVFGFIVLTHYTARFTYTLRDESLRINRMIGKRNKEIEFKCSEITDMYYGFKPVSFPKRYYSMRVSVISQKKSLYIEYIKAGGEKHGVIIEPSDKLLRRIEKERKKADR